MKIFSVLAIFLFVAYASAMNLAEQKAMLMGIAQECRDNEGASDGDLGRLVEHKPPESKEGKCMFACIMEQMDVVSWKLRFDFKNLLS